MTIKPQHISPPYFDKYLEKQTSLEGRICEIYVDLTNFPCMSIYLFSKIKFELILIYVDIEIHFRTIMRGFS